MAAPVRNHTIGAVLVGRDPEDEKDDERSHGGHDKVTRRDKQHRKEQNRTEIGPLEERLLLLRRELAGWVLVLEFQAGLFQ